MKILRSDISHSNKKRHPEPNYILKQKALGKYVVAFIINNEQLFLEY